MFNEGRKYIINLAHRFDRKAAMNAQLNKLNIKHYKWFNAVHHYVGWKGATISHLNIIREALNNNLPYVIIIEDDCVFSPKFNEVIEKIESNIPKEWDIFYWGANHLEGKSIVVAPYIEKCTYATSAMCYAVRNTMYERILKTVQLDKPHDVYYAEMHKDINAYCVLPNLAWQAEGYSDILERKVNYIKEFHPRWV